MRDISNVKQEIINFRKIVRPQRAAFRDLERNKARYIAEDLDIYFDDIIDASERVWDMLENYKEVVEALEATNESAIAHRTNEIFRDPDRDLGDLPAADADRLDLGHERARARRAGHDGVLRRAGASWPSCSAAWSRSSAGAASSSGRDRRGARAPRRGGRARARAAPAAHAGDRQPVRDDDVGPASRASSSTRCRAATTSGGRHRRPRATRSSCAARPRTRATTSSSPSAATARSTRPPTASPAPPPR